MEIYIKGKQGEMSDLDLEVCALLTPGNFGQLVH